MSPTETSLLGGESDSLWQLDGVPYRTSFPSLMSASVRKRYSSLELPGKVESQEQPPDLQVQDVAG